MRAVTKNCTQTICVIATVILLLVLVGCPTQKSGERQIEFSEEIIEIQDYYLFDIGIVDANDDGILDLYTSNHTALQSLLLGDGRGNFQDVYQEWGLSHQKEFPGLEDSSEGPILEEGGIYIYWKQHRLVVHAFFQDRACDISGRLTLNSPAGIVNNVNWDYHIRQDPTAHDLTSTRIDFRLDDAHKEGLLIIEPVLAALPHTFSFDAGIPLSRIFIGGQKTHPSSHTFKLVLKDRHGMAWADWNGDDRMDLFISQGGLGGNIEFYPEVYPYELFVRKGTSLVDVTSGVNLSKSGCRPRQVAWIDVDRDNLLDLFIYGIWSRNHLFKQLPGGQFLDVTKRSGLLDTENGLSAWFDADNDSDLDLFIAGREAFVLYLNQNGYFRKTILKENSEAYRKDRIDFLHFGRPALSDFDCDGDIDIYIASEYGSTLIINNSSAFEFKNPEWIGLPSKAITANWVDVDNDSLPDLHTIPGGLFLQSDELTFREIRVLACDKDETIIDARSNWFDADNDGYRDVLISVLDKKGEDKRIWSSKFFRNIGSNNHWLEIQVAGPSGNRNAIGTSVIVEFNDGRLMTQQVGISEGSHYSQGHYRMYFGLGRDKKPKSLLVIWPDGSREYIEKPRYDCLQKITPHIIS